MSAHEELAAALDRVIPSGEKGDRLKAYLWRLIDADRDEWAAQMVEAYARPPLRTRPRGFGGADFSEAHRGPAS